MPSLGYCVDPFGQEASCLDTVDSELVPAADGTSCTTESGRPGICVTRRCVASLCGDGFVDDSRELCDDGNNNPNDGCDACLTTRWESEVIAGFGESGGDPLALSAEIREVALGPDQTIYAADASRIWRIDASSRFPSVWGGVGIEPGTDALNPAFEGRRATSVTLRFPGELHVDRRENVYFTDRRSVWRICGPSGVSCPAGTLERIAGTGAFGTPVSGAVAREASFGTVSSMAFSRFGDLFILDEQGSSPTVATLYRLCFSGRDCEPGRLTAVFTHSWSALEPNSVEIREIAIDERSLEVPLSVYLAVDFLEAGLSGPTQTRIRRLQLNDTVSTLDDTRVVAGALSGMSPTPEPSPANGIVLNGGVGSIAFDPRGDLLIAAAGGIHRLCLSLDACDAGTLATVLARDPAPADLAPWVEGVLLFVSESRVDALGPEGIQPLVGDGAADPAGDFGAATSARLIFPLGLTLLPEGNLLYASFNERRVRRVCLNDREGCSAGIIQPFAGTGAEGSDGDGGSALEASLAPVGLAADAEGNVYISDRNGDRIREVCRTHCPRGTIRTVAGTGGDGPPVEGVPATESPIGNPTALRLTARGDLLIGTQKRIRRLCLSGDGCALGQIETIAGDGTDTVEYGVPATETGIGAVNAIAASPEGAVFFGGGPLILKLCAVDDDCPQGTLVAVAGTGTNGFSGDGGAATAAQLTRIGAGGLTFDRRGNLLVSDSDNNRVRRVCLSGRDCVPGVIDTVIGDGDFGAPGDPSGDFRGDGGPATLVWLDSPMGLVEGPGGDLFIADASNDVIRTRCGPEGTCPLGFMITVAGAVDPVGDGPVQRSELEQPQDLFPFTGGWLIADGVSGRVRQLSTGTSRLSTIVGYPAPYEQSETARHSPLLHAPRGLAAPSTPDHFFVSEAEGHSIWKITTAETPWVIERFAGSGDRGYLDVSSGASGAHFAQPSGIAFDNERRVLWVADRDNHVVRVVTEDGLQTETRAGRAFVAGFSGDGGSALDALLNSPEAVALGAEGSVYIADTGNRRVRRLAPDGSIDTVVGDGSENSSGAGSPARVFPVAAPRGLWVDRFGNLFIAAGDSIRVIAAGEDEVATGDDSVRTIYGAAPRSRFPDVITRCVTGVHGDDAAEDDDTLFLVDRCARLVIRSTRRSDPGP